MLPPFFNPGPIDFPNIPLYAAAANPYMARLSGELCEGLRLHPVATFRYTREVILPAVAEGAKRGNRDAAAFDLIGAPFMAVGKNEEEVVKAKNALRKQIAFYASTRSYHSVLDHHGWDGLGPKLHEFSLANKWAEMPALITDDMLEEWAVISTYDRLADTLRAKCAGAFNTVTFVLLGETRDDLEMQRDIVAKLHQD